MISKSLLQIAISGFLIYLLLGTGSHSLAATNLKLNQKLDYTSDSNDGPLITGDDMSDGLLRNGIPAYVIFYQRECYNSKRQARRTVELYDKYKGKVDFIVVDLDSRLSKEQKTLRDRYYRGYIPHVTVIDGKGGAVYDRSGEVGTYKISLIFDGML
jgi:hypothetical protein